MKPEHRPTHPPESAHKAGSAPKLSVVIVVGERRSCAEYTLLALRGQTAPDIELVLVDLTEPGTPGVRLPAGLAAQRIPAPPATGWGAARRVGAEAARAPLVAFLEDHCIPRPGWAAAVERAFAVDDVVAVGYSFTNGSPDTYLYRSIFMAEYGLWWAPEDGPARALPANNVAYRRGPLLALGEDLDGALDIDFTAQQRLARSGHRLWVAADAVVAHQSNSTLSDVIRGNLFYARLLASRRRPGWGCLQRALRTLATPVVVPSLRLARLWSAGSRRPGFRRRFVASLPVVLAVYAVAAVGESLGCLVGEGRSSLTLAALELGLPRAAAP